MYLYATSTFQRVLSYTPIPIIIIRPIKLHSCTSVNVFQNDHFYVFSPCSKEIW